MKLYKCYKCREMKEETEFYPNKTHVSRRVTMHCKPCSSKTTTEWQKANRQVRQAWEEKNPDYNAEWRAKNPDKVLESTRRNHPKWRARKRNAEIVETITLDGLYDRDKGICGICKKPVLRCDASHDHKIPLSRGGNHSWDNAQLAHFNCNSRKKDRTPEEYELYCNGQQQLPINA